MSNKIVRTRIAPSPTGYPHIGTIYQSLFDYAFAKKNNGQFIVRIEDTDRQRFVEDAEEKIFSSLDWFGLQEDESPRKGGKFAPYRQSERKEQGIYEQYAHELVLKGHAYYCFCTKERLEEIKKQQQSAHAAVIQYDKHCRTISADEAKKRKDDGEVWVIRLKVPENEKIVVNDEIRGEIEFDSNTIDDQVILKSDGFPTYHLAVVVDDHLMEITHVVRGEEWLSSFPKHVLLYRYFGWEMPRFFHTPVLRNPDKSKLSKRHGHTNIVWYKENGFLPEAILNFLALMGWSNPLDKDKELFSLEEFIEQLDLKDIRPVAPIFDLTKLEWMNGEYIRRCKIEDLRLKILEFDPSLSSLESEMLDGFVGIAQTRMKTLKEFSELVYPFLHNHTVPLSQGEEALKDELRSGLEQLSEWDKEKISHVFIEFLKTHMIKFPVLYRIIIGKEKGLPLADVFEILGREKSLSLL